MAGMKPSRSIVRAGVFTAVFAAGSVHAATIPYTNDFSSTHLGNVSGFSVAGGTLNYTGNTGTTSGTPVAYSSVRLDNSANATYTISTTFKFTALDSSPANAVNSGDQTFAIAAFGLDSAFTGTADATRYILADWTVLSSNAANVGRLRLFEVDGSNTVLGSLGSADTNGTGDGVVTLNTDFTLRLTVTKLAAANTYSISLGLFTVEGSPVGTAASVSSYVATATGSGYFAGVRSRLPVPSLAASPTTIQVDSFSVGAIPEPSSFAAIAGLGALGGVASRRRRVVRG